MASFTKNIAAGNNYCYFGFIDSRGYLVGSTTTAPAAGATGSGMIRLQGVKVAAPTVPEPEVVQVTGDDTLLGEFSFDSIAQRAFIIEFAIQNLETEALLLGTNVETIGEIRLGSIDILDAPTLNGCLILQSRAQKQNTGVVGQAGWTGVIIPLMTAKPLGRASFDERGPAVYRYQITPQIASNNPWGISILEANAGTTGTRYRPFNAENPITMHAHTGNGVVTAFLLDNTPISVAKTVTTATRVNVPLTSVQTTAPVGMTTTGTPIGGAPMVTLYEFTV
jgi:hypothetical protein